MTTDRSIADPATTDSTSADSSSPATPTPASGPARRSTFRSVALPSEHGGWGLTLEPVLLGLLIAPSVAGICLGLAALLGFLARTPLKIVLVDRSRGRQLPRTRTALLVAMVELAAVAALGLVAWSTASGAFWFPLVAAGPLIALELWFDMRSRSRRLVPELAGSFGIASIVAMIVAADGRSAALAVGLWALLAARAVTSVPFVRERVAELHHRPDPPVPLVLWDAVAVVIVVVAAVLDASLVAGALAVLGVIALQRLSLLRPTPRAVVLGIRQTLLGLSVVMITWLGVLVAVQGGT